MIFMGNHFAANKQSTKSIPPTTVLTVLLIQNAIYREVYITNDIIDDFDGVIPTTWDFNTRFHAYFKGDLYAGNVDFTENTVTGLKIKKKTEKDSSYQIIYEKEVYSFEDFEVELLDYLEPVGTITYAFVPMIGNAESDYIVNTVVSQFDAYFIVEKDISYPCNIDASTTQTKNFGATSIKPIGRKYPIVVMNGLTGYKSGDVTATFMDINIIEEGTGIEFREYREIVADFLSNGDPKIFKSFDGDLYMCHVTGDVTDSTRKIYQNSAHMVSYVTSKFSWVETGNAYDAKELAYNGFTDVTSL